MDRKLFGKLQSWKIKERRKPLILMGARQVGKTYLLQKFGELEYKNCVYLNFEENPKLKMLFNDSLVPADIVRNIRIALDASVLPSDTLIIFDEVQECPDALNSLKYFNESAKEYHICAAGSLLGVKLVHTKGFPVGQVDFLHLYPLSFFEFLWALGDTRLYEVLEEYRSTDPLPAIVHDKLLRFFKIYLFTGGMAEAVAEYVKSEDFSKVSEIHQAILQAYSLDFAKHAPPDQLMKINQVWGSIPGQLAKENKKFVYSVIRKGARAREFE